MISHRGRFFFEYSLEFFRHRGHAGPVKRRARYSGPPRVALLIESSRAYGRGLLQGIARYVRERGPWTVFLQERSLRDASPAWLNEWQGEGILARVEDKGMAEAIERLKIPAVDLRVVVPGLNMPSVGPDDAGIGRMGAEHLLERGFRQYAFCGFEGLMYSDARRAAFVTRIVEAGFNCRVFRDPAGPAAGGRLEYEELGLDYEERVSQWLQGLPKPAGLLACNDIRGQQLLAACRALNLAVPDQIAVLGVDNDDVLCELSNPPLTSIVPNSPQIGYQAAALLDGMMAGKRPPAQPVVVPPAGIVTRRSTEVLAMEDRHIAAAVRFIREHACEGIDVSDVLRAVPLSRSTLERRFAVVLRRSPKEEILRMRLDRAKQLLLETDLALPLIAERVGVKHAEYFNVIFKRKTGMSPGKFRARGQRGTGAGREDFWINVPAS